MHQANGRPSTLEIHFKQGEWLRRWVGFIGFMCNIHCICVYCCSKYTVLHLDDGVEARNYSWYLYMELFRLDHVVCSAWNRLKHSCRRFAYLICMYFILVASVGCSVDGSSFQTAMLFQSLSNVLLVYVDIRRIDR